MFDQFAAADFYEHRYAMMEPLFLRPHDKIMLGDSRVCLCRFCGLGEADATFKLKAHAIPEALGNRSITTTYECDMCNQLFGRGIENDLGNWSKPTRTFARISGKNGVPVLKKGSDGGWRIQYGPSGFVIKQYEHDPVCVVDEKEKQIRFELKRDPYTPIAVLKAFVKIGLTLLPPEEMSNFVEALAWIREPDHTKGLVREFPIVRTFLHGPMPNDLIVAWLLRRRALATDVPYAFLILAYGNEVFQVALPSPRQDAAINGRPIKFPSFPTPGGPDPKRYGTPSRTLLDLTGRLVVRGEIAPFVLGFEHVTVQTLSGDPTPS